MMMMMMMIDFDKHVQYNGKCDLQHFQGKIGKVSRNESTITNLSRTHINLPGRRLKALLLRKKSGESVLPHSGTLGLRISLAMMVPETLLFSLSTKMSWQSLGYLAVELVSFRMRLVAHILDDGFVLWKQRVAEVPIPDLGRLLFVVSNQRRNHCHDKKGVHHLP